MYFTKEDYLNIEKWLQQRSIKDSEFPHAPVLNGEELVTIVQNNINKSVKLNSLFDLKVVSDLFKNSILWYKA